jgi:hypothetical protein
VGASKLVATSAAGVPNVYDGSQWTAFGPAGDQFVPTTYGIVALAMDHSAVSLGVSLSSAGWLTIGGPASELFGGATSNLVAATTPGPTKNVFAIDLTLPLLGGAPVPVLQSSWQSQGGPGNMFAVAGPSGSENLWGLTPTRVAVWQSINTSIWNPPWEQVSFAEGRIVADTVQGIPVVYMTDCPTPIQSGTCTVY